MLYYWCYWKR